MYVFCNVKIFSEFICCLLYFVVMQVTIGNTVEWSSTISTSFRAVSDKALICSVCRICHVTVCQQKPVDHYTCTLFYCVCYYSNLLVSLPSNYFRCA